MLRLLRCTVFETEFYMNIGLGGRKYRSKHGILMLMFEVKKHNTSSAALHTYKAYIDSYIYSLT